MKVRYEKFAELLEKNNVKASEVCERTGVSAVTLSEWKNGKYTPKTEKLYLIAQFFGVDIEYFIEKVE